MPAATELQAAIYSALTGAGLTVYDAVPENAAFPYVTIGYSQELPFDTHTSRGREIVSTIHIWSRYPGAKEIKELAATVISTLDRTSLTLPNWHHVYTLFDSATYLQDPDGITRHAVVEFRSLLQQA